MLRRVYFSGSSGHKSVTVLALILNSRIGNIDNVSAAPREIHGSTFASFITAQDIVEMRASSFGSTVKIYFYFHRVFIDASLLEDIPFEST